MERELGQIEYEGQTYNIKYNSDKALVYALKPGQRFWTECGMAADVDFQIIDRAKTAIRHGKI